MPSCEHCGYPSDERLVECGQCRCGMCPTCADLHDERSVCPIDVFDGLVSLDDDEVPHG